MFGLAPLAPLAWIALGILGACAITAIVVFAVATRGAEIGVDPFANLPTFDDDEADRLLEQGA